MVADAWVGDVDHRKVEIVEPARQFGRGERGHGRGVTDQKFDPRRRYGRVDRQIGGAGFQDRQNRDDRVCRAWEQQRHPLTRARAMVNQHVRQLIRPRVELAVGHRDVGEGQRYRVGVARGLGGEQLRDRLRGCPRLCQDCLVAPVIELGVFAAIQQID
ncbi:hypothetical protein MAGR_19560 [Mycolicibacterium agri]|uniref:Uncharacterized protein n=1 Tax=Mycolicibacterium agri TaxID=36811 RepID=A0A7I9VYH7_MYCAG|nr:hypothetical protein MAGR_19560 [Mycolicibacterium agri]